MTARMSLSFAASIGTRNLAPGCGSVSSDTRRRFRCRSSSGRSGRWLNPHSPPPARSPGDGPGDRMIVGHAENQPLLAVKPAHGISIAMSCACGVPGATPQLPFAGALPQAPARHTTVLAPGQWPGVEKHKLIPLDKPPATRRGLRQAAKQNTRLRRVLKPDSGDPARMVRGVTEATRSFLRERLEAYSRCPAGVTWPVHVHCKIQQCGNAR